MNVQIGETVLELVQGNIVQQEVDAIVNAANCMVVQRVARKHIQELN